MIYSRGTSTKEAYSQTEVIEELLDIVDMTSQQQWSPSPREGSPPEKEKESESKGGSVRESKQEKSTEIKGEEEKKTGGAPPPLIPPQ
uniref:ORF3 n=1 Tax=Torque teno Leptonychotes weddellii virus-1 TaxID=2012676 RepID=A0A1Z2RWT9_9VIRU|nr:ORF3 [Torque teno Leptonychotes weddellii virus 1]